MTPGTTRERSTLPLPLLSVWSRAVAQAAAALPNGDATSVDWYRVGDGLLMLAGNHHAFRATVNEIFGDCRVAQPVDDVLPCVGCIVRRPDSHGFTVIEWQDAHSGPLLDFALAVLAERGFVEGRASDDGWRFMVSALQPDAPLLAMRGDHLVAREGSGWEGILANIAIACVMRRQRDCLFFHAGTVSIAGRGIMLCGPKAAGKTTATLALAMRGHDLLGDEIAALRIGTRELLPVRRALSIREGPASAAAFSALERLGSARVRYPDGELRTRARVSALAPGSRVASAPLVAIFLLSGFAPQPRLMLARSARANVLTPLAATIWGPAGGAKAMHLLRLVAEVPCYVLESGTPDDTARLIEATITAEGVVE